MSYRLVIFDFDGTLADSAAWFRTNFNAVARRFRFRELTPAEFEAMRTKTSREVMAELGVSTWKLPFIARYVRREMRKAADDIRVFPGVHELLLALAERDVVIAVVTSNAEANVRAILGPTSAARI